MFGSLLLLGHPSYIYPNYEAVQSSLSNVFMSEDTQLYKYTPVDHNIIQQLFALYLCASQVSAKSLVCKCMPCHLSVGVCQFTSVKVSAESVCEGV